MGTVDFRSVANLINRSVYTNIYTDPIKQQKDNWALYKGSHKPPPGFDYPFYVLYLHSDATKDSMENAVKELIDQSLTIVVYAPSLDANTKYHHKLFKDGFAGFYTTREYLLAFVKDKVSTYRNNLLSIEPQYYVDPHFEAPSGFKHKYPNPLKFLLEYDKVLKDPRDGMLTVLLAEPGQGKTYQSKYLASTLANSNILPIFIQSEQWRNLSIDDLSSIWKTVTHSFKYFHSPIEWIEGHEQEFLDITLRAGLFTIIFDGFDEYILWNHGSVNAQDVLLTLSNLARETGAPILLTSRTSFWNSDLFTAPEAPEKPIYILLPFDRNNAKVYFQKRFSDDSSRVNRALAIFDELSKSRTTELYGNFAGRGFVLYHIADIVERTDKNPTITTKRSSVIEWVMNAICEREYTRQNLPINASEQIEMFRHFAEETSRGSEANTNILRTIISALFSDKLTNEQIEDLFRAPESGERGNLQDHPLINKDPSRDHWEFVQEQVRFCLLAGQLLNYANNNEIPSIKLFIKGISYTGSLYIDIANAIVDHLVTDVEGLDLHNKVTWLIGLLIECCDAASIRKGDPKRNLITTIALFSLNRLFPLGSDRKERTNKFISFFPESSLKDLLFYGTISSMDFSGIKFTFCYFNQVTFANCIFDEDTVFDNCSFSGAKLINSSSFGKAKWERGWIDFESASLINLSKISAGKKGYTQEDLKKDIRYVINKFIPREGLFIMVSESILLAGTIAHSPNKDTIIKSLVKWVLAVKKHSGASENTYYVKEEAKESIIHYTTNGVLTGPLAEAFTEIIKKLKINM